MIEKNALTKDMKNAMIKVKVLKIIAAKRTYPYAIIKEIVKRKHMAQFFSGRAAIKDEIYNTINVLEKSGYIKMAGQSKSERTTNYYIITKKGRDALYNTKKVFLSSMKEISNMFK